MKTAIVFYLLSMTCANLLVGKFGPSITPLLAFFLIGLDLVLRDWLHLRLKPIQMLSLITASGAFTFLLNPATGIIAIASAVAFTAAALVDWAVFSRVVGSWIKRSNSSNVAAAAVDSFVFPTIAFGVLMPHIIAMQFAAKVIGGALWAFAINKFNACEHGRS